MADNLHIQNPSITSGAFASMLAFSAGTDIITAISGHPIGGVGGGGTPDEGYWRPLYNDNTGDLSWLWSVESTANTPTSANIRGPQGEDGEAGTSVRVQSIETIAGGTQVTVAWGEDFANTSSFLVPSGVPGANGKDGKDGQTGSNGQDGANGISPTVTTATIEGTPGGVEVTISGADGEHTFEIYNGQDGASGAKGEDGFSPTVTTAGIDPTTEHPQGGTSVTITDKTGPNQFNVWNGINGEGASLSAGSGINIDNNSINVKLGKNLKFDTYRNVTTEDNISAFSFHAGEYNNRYTIVNKTGVESHFTSSPDLHLMTLTTHGLNNATTGANRCITADYDLNHLFFKSYDNNGTYSGDYSQVEIKVLQKDQPAETQHRSSIELTDYYGGVEHAGLITVEKIAQWDQGGGFTGVTTAGSISGDGLTNPLCLKASAENALAAVDGKMTKPTTTQYQNDYVVWNKGLGQEWTNFNTAAESWANSFLLDANAPFISGADGLSAGLVQGANNYVYKVGINTANMNPDRYYGFTTNGWVEINNWIMNRFQFENGISGVPDMSTYQMHIGLSGDYLPKSGGTVSGDIIVKSTGNNILAVNTTATLMGQSRVANLTDTTAIGTNWLGVNSYGGGFLKNVQGGDVGALNGTTIQINFAPDGANSYGNITVDSQGNQSKVVHVPTASYNSMSSFDNTNGPNYMLRKTASGFDIGAAVINVTALPQQTEANAYYFVYDA